MQSIIRSIVRTPGVLFMAIMTLGFLTNAGVEYINYTGNEGPNLLAAVALGFAQIILIAVYQAKRIQQKRSTPAIKI